MNPDAQWSTILFDQYASHEAFYYGLKDDDINYITRIWIMHEVAAGWENSIEKDILSYLVVNLVRETPHSKRLQMAVMWGIMSVGMFGVGGATNLDALKATVIKATSGFAGTGSYQELAQIYGTIGCLPR